MILIRRCMKCRKFLGLKFTKRIRDLFKETTGLCDKCFEKEKKEIKEYKRG